MRKNAENLRLTLRREFAFSTAFYHPARRPRPDRRLLARDANSPEVGWLREDLPPSRARNTPRSLAELKPSSRNRTSIDREEALPSAGNVQGEQSLKKDQAALATHTVIPMKSQ